MSDFWKKRRPRLSEDEERALWERVRTLPAEAAARGRGVRARPPWAALWARPAVRFGAPVLAVTLVAIVWVAQREPAAPLREGVVATVPLEKALPPVVEVAPAPESAPAPVPSQVAGRDARATDDAPARVAEEGLSPAAPVAERESRSRHAAPLLAKEATTSAAPPAAAPPAPSTAAVDRKDEGARVSAKASASQPLAASQGEASQDAGGLQTFRAARGNDPLATRRIAAIRADDYASRLLADVVRPATAGPFGTIVKLPITGTTVYLKRQSGIWQILDDPLVLEGALSAPGRLERRAALAVELIRAAEAADPAAIDRAHEAAVAFLRDQPADEGARALVAWATAARAAFDTP